MNLANLDPFNLAKLSSTIDRGIFRIIARDFPAIVSEDSLRNIKLKIRDEANTLVVEMWNDIRHLNTHPKIGDFFGAEERLPTLQQMAKQLPIVFSIPPNTGDEDVDDKALIQYHIGRVKWSFNIWIQVYGYFIKRVAVGSSVATEAIIETEGGEELIRIPSPLEIDMISNAWQISRRLTIEYLKAKAELLIAVGEDVPQVMIDDNEDNDQDSISLRKAFWNNDPNASILMLHALRSALLRSMGLKEQPLPIDLRCLLTSQLLVLAQGAELQVPVELNLLGNIAYDLEGAYSFCESVPITILYPFYLILETTITALNKMPVDKDVHKRALNILSQNAQRLTNESGNQADN